ncbi:hypothetical protein HDU67_000964 [Dinochytrium kinnereticum]|nr:hypothetical protein HDU67_000964 [Dinochytrium kinnereticum]
MAVVGSAISTEARMNAEVASMLLARDQAADSLAHAVGSIRSGFFATANGIRDVSHHLLILIRLYAMRNPTFRIFLLLAGILSILPVSVFAFFAVTTLLGSLVTAVLGLLFVEGSLLGLGLAILLPIEAGILVVAGGAALAYSNGKTLLKAIEGPSDKKAIQGGHVQVVEESPLALMPSSTPKAGDDPKETIID